MTVTTSLFNFFGLLASFALAQNKGRSNNPQPVSVTIDSYQYKRLSPPSPLPGTINWKRVNSGSTFSPRHSHATCVFKCPGGSSINGNNINGNTENTNKCIWLTGGYSEEYRTFNTELSNRNADVWWTKNGATWNKVLNLTGDFLDGVGNYDAKYGGSVAPWYSRYGHSVDAVDGDDDGVADAMILLGGFNPIPSNDIWITLDGSTWHFGGYAPWPARAYHATAVFRGELWIMGGTPFKNDVWSGKLLKDPKKKAGYKMVWKMRSAHMTSPWSPRAGHCAVTQLRRDSYNGTEAEATYSDWMYVIGGFGGYPNEDRRARNDVWMTQNGVQWEQAKPPEGKNRMPWGARSWHACVTWHNPTDRSKGVNTAAIDDFLRRRFDETTMHPRIYIIGGGYSGTNGNNVVRSMEGYVDMWWSHDGSEWNKVNYEEGSKTALYSTNEWSLTRMNSRYIHLGKWGHSVVSFPTEFDFNNDGSISNDPILLEFCGGENGSTTACKILNTTENQMPSLFVIGGDTMEKGPVIGVYSKVDGPVVNDVFMTTPGVNCEQNGVSCSKRGTCAPLLGCICDAELFIGEFCERVNSDYRGTARQTSLACSYSFVLFLIITLMIWS